MVIDGAQSHTLLAVTGWISGSSFVLCDFEEGAAKLVLAWSVFQNIWSPPSFDCINCGNTGVIFVEEIVQ